MSEIDTSFGLLQEISFSHQACPIKSASDKAYGELGTVKSIFGNDTDTENRNGSNALTISLAEKQNELDVLRAHVTRLTINLQEREAAYATVVMHHNKLDLKFSEMSLRSNDMTRQVEELKKEIILRTSQHDAVVSNIKAENAKREKALWARLKILEEEEYEKQTAWASELIKSELARKQTQEALTQVKSQCVRANAELASTLQKLQSNRQHSEGQVNDDVSEGVSSSSNETDGSTESLTSYQHLRNDISITTNDISRRRTPKSEGSESSFQVQLSSALAELERVKEESRRNVDNELIVVHDLLEMQYEAVQQELMETSAELSSLRTSLESTNCELQKAYQGQKRLEQEHLEKQMAFAEAYRDSELEREDLIRALSETGRKWDKDTNCTPRSSHRSVSFRREIESTLRADKRADADAGTADENIQDITIDSGIGVRSPLSPASPWRGIDGWDSVDSATPLCPTHLEWEGGIADGLAMIYKQHIDTLESTPEKGCVGTGGGGVASGEKEKLSADLEESLSLSSVAVAAEMETLRSRIKELELSRMELQEENDREKEKVSSLLIRVEQLEGVEMELNAVRARNRCLETHLLAIQADGRWDGEAESDLGSGEGSIVGSVQGSLVGKEDD